jgi:hypothetical protein
LGEQKKNAENSEKKGKKMKKNEFLLDNSVGLSY